MVDLVVRYAYRNLSVNEVPMQTCLIFEAYGDLILITDVRSVPHLSVKSNHRRGRPPYVLSAAGPEIDSHRKMSRHNAPEDLVHDCFICAVAHGHQMRKVLDVDTKSGYNRI